MQFFGVNEWKTYVEKCTETSRHLLEQYQLRIFYLQFQKCMLNLSYTFFFFNLRSYIQRSWVFLKLSPKHWPWPISKMHLWMCHLGGRDAGLGSGLWLPRGETLSIVQCVRMPVCLLAPTWGKCPSWIAGPSLFLGPQTIFFLWRLCFKIY